MTQQAKDILDLKEAPSQKLPPKPPSQLRATAVAFAPKSSDQAQASASTSAPVVTHCDGLQTQLNLELVQVLQGITKDKKEKDKQQHHVSDTWEDVIIPYVTCEHVISVHDSAQNTYGQRVSCNAARSLMKMN